uniref:DNA-directed DNA polymerase n=1 Tax=Strigamia maritima TaxID=126957 RepID=T1JF04_STRMM
MIMPLADFVAQRIIFCTKTRVIFHNLKNYDAHLLIEGIGKFKERKINCIPLNMERYIRFPQGNLQFLDSLQFMNASLETLTSNLLKSGPEKFKIMDNIFSQIKFIFFKKKGIFPYEYVNSFQKFN